MLERLEQLATADHLVAEALSGRDVARVLEAVERALLSQPEVFAEVVSQLTGDDVEVGFGAHLGSKPGWRPISTQREKFAHSGRTGCSPDQHLAEAARARGNAFFQKAQYDAAVESYTEALQYQSALHPTGRAAASRLFSNRAAALLRLHAAATASTSRTTSTTASSSVAIAASSSTAASSPSGCTSSDPQSPPSLLALGDLRGAVHECRTALAVEASLASGAAVGAGKGRGSSGQGGGAVTAAVPVGEAAALLAELQLQLDPDPHRGGSQDPEPGSKAQGQEQEGGSRQRSAAGTTAVQGEAPGGSGKGNASGSGSGSGRGVGVGVGVGGAGGGGERKQFQGADGAAPEGEGEVEQRRLPVRRVIDTRIVEAYTSELGRHLVVSPDASSPLPPATDVLYDSPLAAVLCKRWRRRGRGRGRGGAGSGVGGCRSPSNSVLRCWRCTAVLQDKPGAVSYPCLYCPMAMYCSLYCSLGTDDLIRTAVLATTTAAAYRSACHVALRRWHRQRLQPPLELQDDDDDDDDNDDHLDDLDDLDDIVKGKEEEEEEKEEKENLEQQRRERRRRRRLQSGAVPVGGLRPPEVTAREIFLTMCRVRVNGIAVRPDVMTSPYDRLALALYPRAALLNHSCVPNLGLRFLGLRLVARSCREVLPGQPLTISYGPQQGKMPRASRVAALQAQYAFSCGCDACATDPRVTGHTAELEAALWGLKCPGCSTWRGDDTQQEQGSRTDNARPSAESEPLVALVYGAVQYMSYNLIALQLVYGSCCTEVLYELEPPASGPLCAAASSEEGGGAGDSSAAGGGGAAAIAADTSELECLWRGTRALYGCLGWHVLGRRL
ncbi:SET domain-containing protein [Volvox carteri f. nagariensis]|uniref:SET domain-containing protein n=1 Tax=Volvox carteri f. nagariensis TaxID=3068 RepID=D8TVT3_VOLCA|nr:SET domain-containing protein [Volvox carteri f. nagariensis]EFJ48358.1 SET domain-containing protein [Volvox carteri f. nagariensis]|eukprot:XP_002950612.1 SET domain-containing protein [Volvox carteri f. nagariensis]